MEIHVQFFGKFNIAYDDIPLVGEKIHKESQFNRLLLALFYAWPEGMRRDELERFVIGETELDRDHTDLRIIIYKAKKKLVKLGLPDINLIYQEKGIVFWCSEIPVTADCHEMERCYEEAESLRDSQNSADIERSMSLYMDAAYFYKGEFLELYASEMLAIRQAARYRDLFVKCIDRASEMLEKLHNWDALETLGRFAVTAQPYSNWEILVMEALVQKHLYEDAATYYADVVDTYLRECGVYPSRKLMKIMDEIEDSLQHTRDDLDAIQGALEESGQPVGGYYCSFPAFKGIYQMQQRQMERNGQNAYLLLCTVHGRGRQPVEGDRLESLANDLRNAVGGSIRRGDMYTQYGKGQVLVFLTNTSLENCDIVKQRITKAFAAKGNTEPLVYHLNCVNPL